MQSLFLCQSINIFQNQLKSKFSRFFTNVKFYIELLSSKDVNLIVLSFSCNFQKREFIPKMTKQEFSKLQKHFSNTNQGKTKMKSLLLLSSENKKRIMIIGGGAAGLSMVAHLLQSLVSQDCNEKTEIILFERSKRVGPGFAYGTSSNANLINTPAKSMGIYASNPGHFLEWLEANPTRWRPHYPKLVVGPNSNPPRKLFGLYLEQMSLELMVQAQKNGIELRYIHQEVINVETSEEKATVILENGMAIEGNAAVLAIGAFSSTQFSYLKGLKGYLSSPFPEVNIFKSIPTTADVSIIGSRLSAIDAILTLKKAGHKGKIRCFSRQGFFPSVQGLWGNYSQKFLTEDNFKKLTNNGQRHLPLNKLLVLMAKEIRAAENRHFKWSDLITEKKEAASKLLQDIELADNKEIKWQSALPYDLVFPLGRLLSDKDKKIFIEKCASHFLCYKAAFPIESAKTLHQLMVNGELEVHAGLNSVHFDSATEQFVFDCAGKISTSSYVVDATGISADIRYTDHSLIKGLRESGLISAHSCEGIELDEKTLNVIDTSGKVLPQLFAIGALAKGVHLFTNLLSYVAQSAAEAAQHVIRQIQPMPPSIPSIQLPKVKSRKKTHKVHALSA